MDAQGLRDALASQCPTFKLRAIGKLDVGKLSERRKDITAVTTYLRGVQTKSAYVERQGTKTIRTGLFLLHAVKGGGKTVLLKKIAAHHAVQKDAGIFVTYNGGSPVYPVTPWDELRCFAVQLLLSQGVPVKIAARVESLVVALKFMRKAKNLSSSAPLTICVDEIVALDGQKVSALGPGSDPAQATISALMRYQDDVTNKGTRGRVYFIFSSLIASYADKTGSSRIIWKHGLKNLTHKAAVSLLSGKAKELYENMPAVRWIFAILAGHPRAVVDGFMPLVQELEGTGTKKSSDAAVTTLLWKILMHCKFEQHMDLPYVREVVRNWIADAEQEDRARTKGWLQTGSAGKEILMPLVLRHYSESKDVSEVRLALKQLYHADQAVSKGQEKKAEALVAHFEILKKLCLDGTTGVAVQKFFDGGRMKRDGTTNLGERRLYWGKKAATFDVQSFRKEDFSEFVVPSLLRGQTAISQAQNEPGVEYLCPFFKRPPSASRPYTEKDLLVAKVQVKYGNTPPAWTDIVSKVNRSRASEALKEAAIDSFTVLYTIAGNVPDQKKEEMSENVVYYDRKGMKSYTAKLGPLRYDYEKAEKKLSS